MNGQNIIIALLLIIAGLVWGWRNLHDQGTEEPTVMQQTPDFTASDLYTVTYNKLGLVRYRIYADGMKYYERNQTTDFDSPRILIYPGPDKPVWQIVSRQAQALRQDKVTFKEDVVVKNLSNDGYIQDLLTPLLHVNLTNQTMQTDKQVTVNGPQYDQNGIGMNGSLVTEEVRLHQDINAVYHNEEN
ncbi:LPS export ABC transporter periplasmic protein LptC [Celerinatantimonas sp. YJH-8]|uniref:LPS export ABC transporter periplasmic protein LptC n=1 Tax=Celerinatantimonas sp. YJH-8 TaxID=3228714 RepID=UPI0038CB0E32